MYDIIDDLETWQPSTGDRPMYDGPDMPSSDLPEDHHGPEPQPAPLDVSRLHKIKGYETVGYYTGKHSRSKTSSYSAPPIPPPTYDNLPHLDHHSRPREEFSSVAHISEEEAREALLGFAAEKRCYGKSSAKHMQIVHICPSSALHYTLETYTETRTTSWEQEPFRGQSVDCPSNGPAPAPWDIHCNPTHMFHDEVQKIEVPHTATIMPCHGCGSLGWVRCHSCLGRGFKRCMYCHGSGRLWKTDAHGHRHVESCWHCHGTGRKRCLSCGGDGRVVCRTCTGYRQLKCFIRLTITYTNNFVEHIVEHTDMPEELVKTVRGAYVFDQTQPRVWPISNYPDRDVCLSSQRLVTEEQTTYDHARILMQRQRLRAIPVSECTFAWKEDEGRFWVYGKENAVYAPEYPQKCCWGCTIL